MMKKSKWITDRKPPEGERVLMVISAYDVLEYYVGSYETWDEYGILNTDAGTFQLGHLEAWMPIPEFNN